MTHHLWLISYESLALTVGQKLIERYKPKRRILAKVSSIFLVFVSNSAHGIILNSRFNFFVSFYGVLLVHKCVGTWMEVVDEYKGLITKCFCWKNFMKTTNICMSNASPFVIILETDLRNISAIWNALQWEPIQQDEKMFTMNSFHAELNTISSIDSKCWNLDWIKCIWF